MPYDFSALLQRILIGGAAIVGLTYLFLIRVKLEAQPAQCMVGLLFGLIILATLIASTD